MKTITAPPKNIRDTENNALVIRLERIQGDLKQLRDSINSYRYEPRTYVLFEYAESLRNGIDKLNTSNLEIIRKLKNDQNTFHDFIIMAKQQLVKFDQLQKRVVDYRMKFQRQGQF